MPRVFALLALVAACLLAGCKSDSPNAPLFGSAPTVTGTWAGQLTIDGVTGRMVWTLAQTNSDVSGPVAVSLPNGTVLMNGTLVGTLTGSSLTYLITVQAGGVPTRPACGGTLSGTMTLTAAALGQPAALEGPMAVTANACLPPLTGLTLRLTKQ